MATKWDNSVFEYDKPSCECNSHSGHNSIDLPEDRPDLPPFYASLPKSSKLHSVIDKLQKLKCTLNSAHNTVGRHVPQSDRSYVEDLLNKLVDILNNRAPQAHSYPTKLDHEDGLRCNGLWRKYGG